MRRKPLPYRRRLLPPPTDMLLWNAGRDARIVRMWRLARRVGTDRSGSEQLPPNLARTSGQ